MKLFFLLFAAALASSAATIVVGVGCDRGAVSAASSGQAISCSDPEDTFNSASGYASVTESSTQISINSSIFASFAYVSYNPSGPTSASAVITETFTPNGTGSGYLAFGGGAGASDGGLDGAGVVDLSVYVNGSKVTECVDLCTNPFPFSVDTTLGTPITLTIDESAAATSSEAGDSAGTDLTISAFAADGTPETLIYAPEPGSVTLTFLGICLLAAALKLRSRSTNPV